MKNSLMLWTLCVLLLSVMIECKNKTEEEKPKQGFLQDLTNSTVNTTAQNETDLHPKGNLGEAKQIQQKRFNGKPQKNKNSPRRPRTEGPAARTEVEGPAARTETLPRARTEAEGPAARTEVEGPAARVEVPSARIESPKKKRLSEARKKSNK